MGTRRYGFDFLNTLSQKIGDLSGFVQMSRELIQNADDEECNWIMFHFTEDALIVKNPSEFDEEDFENITTIGKEGKIEDAEKTGRFGVGFVSVFQISDHPVVRSSGSELTIYPERQEAEERDISPFPGTEFVLPWARQQSSVREKLKKNIITENDIQSFSEELIPSLPDTMLFLRHIRRVEVILPHGMYISAIRNPDEGFIRTIIIHEGRKLEKVIGKSSWFVLEEPENQRR